MSKSGSQLHSRLALGSQIFALFLLCLFHQNSSCPLSDFNFSAFSRYFRLILAQAIDTFIQVSTSDMHHFLARDDVAPLVFIH